MISFGVVWYWSGRPLLIISGRWFDYLKSRRPVNLEHCPHPLGSARLFRLFFKSCGGQKKGKILKKVAVGAPAKVCLGQNLDFVRRSVIPKSLKIEYMKGNFAKLGFIRQNFAKISKIYQNFAKKWRNFRTSLPLPDIVEHIDKKLSQKFCKSCGAR